MASLKERREASQREKGRFQPPRTFGLGDNLNFGKRHRGTSMGAMLDDHPGYLAWVHREVQHVSFTDEVHTLFEDMWGQSMDDAYGFDKEEKE